MKLKRKLLKERVIYLLYNLVLLAFAFVFERFLQMLMFLLFFNSLQNCFAFRFHSNTIVENPIKAVKYCKIITIVIEIIYLSFCKELDVSVYSNLFVIFVIAFTNALLQFYCEKTIITKARLSNLDDLKYLCEEAHLSQLATNRMIMRFVEKKSISEIATIEFVDDETIKKSIQRSRKKLNL